MSGDLNLPNPPPLDRDAWHIVVGCLLLALPGAILLYYALSQTGIESKTLHIMEGGA
jgi:hypothetical protein